MAHTKGQITQRENRRAKKKALVDVFNNRCAMCGKTFPDCCFDFHHVDPTTKDTTVGNLINCTYERALEEAKKCIMVCSNCHRIIHRNIDQDCLPIDFKDFMFA